MKTNKGFSLIEVIVVLIIIGVLAGLAVPRYETTVERFRSSEGVQILTALLGAQKRYQLENGSFTSTIANLDITIPNPDNFNAPTVSTSNPIARIGRTGGAYTLRINSDGTITCTGGGGICAKIGY